MAENTKHDRFDEEVDMILTPPSKPVEKNIKKALSDWEKLVNENFNKLGE